MVFVEGQGILGKIRFVDGEFPEYNRTYLVITAEKRLYRSVECFIHKRKGM